MIEITSDVIEEAINSITIDDIRSFLKFHKCNISKYEVDANAAIGPQDTSTRSKFFTNYAGNEMEWQVTYSLYMIRAVQWRLPFESVSFEKEWQVFLARKYKEKYIDGYKASRTRDINRKFDEYYHEIQDYRQQLDADVIDLKLIASES